MLTKAQVKDVQQTAGQSGSRLLAVFSALSDAGRYRIFKLLMLHDDLCVTDVANVFEISVPAASQQLKIMEMSGLVTKERDGQMICYAINKQKPVVRAFMRIVASLDSLTD